MMLCIPANGLDGFETTVRMQRQVRALPWVDVLLDL